MNEACVLHPVTEHPQTVTSAKMGCVLVRPYSGTSANMGTSRIGTSANMGRVTIRGYNLVAQFQHWAPRFGTKPLS